MQRTAGNARRHCSTAYGNKLPELTKEIQEKGNSNMREAIDYAIRKGKALDENYQLHFYALYLLGELQDRKVDEFVRTAMLDVMGQLYLDGILEEGEWKDFLKQGVYDGREYDYFYNSIGHVICQCHFIDMLPEIRYMFDKDLLEEMDMGKYDSYVDAMFAYREKESSFCTPHFHTADALKHWAMFSESCLCGNVALPGVRDISYSLCEN